jgi:hypothetical protein
MARGHCWDCDGLVEITPTGMPIDGSLARYWRLVMHAKPPQRPREMVVLMRAIAAAGRDWFWLPTRDKVLCDGGGKLV